jgi:hypothetical protein
VACRETEPTSPEKVIDIYGRWVVAQYLSTNGPICYDILLNDTVSFEKAGNIGKSLIYSYELFGRQCRDTLEFDKIEISGKMSGKGNYLHADSTVAGPIGGRAMIQTLEIDWLADHQIECRMRVENYYSKTNEYIFGDVSHFIGKKIGN